MTDQEQLRLLAIFHYIVGGLEALFSSIGLIHFFLGLAFLLEPAFFSEGAKSGPPPFFGAIFMVVGGGIVLSGWTIGGLTIYSGRCIAKRVKRTFSIVIGCINCAIFPVGTALGAFTVIVLSRKEIAGFYPSPADRAT